MSIVASIAAVAGCILAVAAVALLIRRPVKWLWRKNITEPVTAWFRREVQEVVNDELDRRPLTNGWGTKAMHAVAVAVDAQIEPPHTERPPVDE